MVSVKEVSPQGPNSPGRPSWSGTRVKIAILCQLEKTSGRRQVEERFDTSLLSNIFHWRQNTKVPPQESERSEVAQWCLTLWDPMDCSLPGSSLHGILQARVLEWVAISFSRGSSQLRERTGVSHIPGKCFNLWATREAQANQTWTYFSCHYLVQEDLKENISFNFLRES